LQGSFDSKQKTTSQADQNSQVLNPNESQGTQIDPNLQQVNIELKQAQPSKAATDGATDTQPQVVDVFAIDLGNSQLSLSVGVDDGGVSPSGGKATEQDNYDDVDKDEDEDEEEEEEEDYMELYVQKELKDKIEPLLEALKGHKEEADKLQEKVKEQECQII